MSLAAHGPGGRAGRGLGRWGGRRGGEWGSGDGRQSVLGGAGGSGAVSVEGRIPHRRRAAAAAALPRPARTTQSHHPAGPRATAGGGGSAARVVRGGVMVVDIVGPLRAACGASACAPREGAAGRSLRPAAPAGRSSDGRPWAAAGTPPAPPDGAPPGVAPRPRRRTRRQSKSTQPSISSLSLGPCQEPKARAQQRMALRPQRGQSGRRAQANRHAAPAAATVYFVDSCRPCGGLTAAAGGGNAPGRPACPPRGRRRQLGDAASAGGPHVRFRAPRAYTEYGPAVHCHDRVHPSGVPTGGPLGWWLPLPALCGSHPCWLARPRNAPPLCARKLHVRRAHRVPVGAGGGATILAAAVLGSPPLARVRSAGGAAAAPARTRRATPLCWHVAAPRHRGPDTPSPSLCFRNGQGG